MLLLVCVAVTCSVDKYNLKKKGVEHTHCSCLYKMQQQSCIKIKMVWKCATQ